jgi:hypothetical protein
LRIEALPAAGGGFMGLADWFSTFCSDLQVKNAESISQRYKAITQRLNTDFWATTSDTAHSHYVGSYGRNTAIDGFSDLEMVFELPAAIYHQYNAHENTGQSALLQVRASVRRTYLYLYFQERGGDDSQGNPPGRTPHIRGDVSELRRFLAVQST